MPSPAVFYIRYFMFIAENFFNCFQLRSKKDIFYSLTENVTFSCYAILFRMFLSRYQTYLYFLWGLF